MLQNKRLLGPNERELSEVLPRNTLLSRLRTETLGLIGRPRLVT
jgi:hypothetical protein